MSVPSRYDILALGVYSGPSEIAAIRNMIRHDDRNALHRVGRECSTKVVPRTGITYVAGFHDSALCRVGLNDWQVVPLALVQRTQAKEAVALWRAIAEGVNGVELNAIHTAAACDAMDSKDTGELLAEMCLDRVIFPVGCSSLVWATGPLNFPANPSMWNFIKKPRQRT